jgi:HAMP domain-containing protein
MPLLDLVPVISAIIGIIGISFKAGKILQKLDYVIDEVDELKQEVKEMRIELKDLDRRVIFLETKIAGSKK